MRRKIAQRAAAAVGGFLLRCLMRIRVFGRLSYFQLQHIYTESFSCAARFGIFLCFHIHTRELSQLFLASRLLVCFARCLRRFSRLINYYLRPDDMTAWYKQCVFFLILEGVITSRVYNINNSFEHHTTWHHRLIYSLKRKGENAYFTNQPSIRQQEQLLS